MKKIGICIVAMSLAGCLNLSFDNLEYDRYVTMKLTAQHGAVYCGKPEAKLFAQQLKELSNHQKEYADNRGGRATVKTAASALNQLVDELNAKYETETPSDAYCKQKFTDIKDGATDVVFALGKLN